MTALQEVLDGLEAQTAAKAPINPGTKAGFRFLKLQLMRGAAARLTGIDTREMDGEQIGAALHEAGATNADLIRFYLEINMCMERVIERAERRAAA